MPWPLSRPPLAGSKSVASRKYQKRTDTSHSLRYIRLSSGDWLLGVVKGRGVSSSSFLGGFKGWSRGLEVWTPLKEVVSIWLASYWGEIAARILCGGYADAWGYVKNVRLVWHWVILNCLFRFCIQRTGHLPSVTYNASKGWCRGRIRREASNFPDVGLVFYFVQLRRVQFMCYVLRDFNVHHSNCNVLLWPVNTEIVL